MMLMKYCQNKRCVETKFYIVGEEADVMTDLLSKTLRAKHKNFSFEEDIWRHPLINGSEAFINKEQALEIFQHNRKVQLCIVCIAMTGNVFEIEHDPGIKRKEYWSKYMYMELLIGLLKMSIW